MTKKNVYLIDLGSGADTNLLPLSIGTVASYARKFSEINDIYDIDLSFTRKAFRDTLTRLDDPKVIGLACYVWNIHANLHFARLAKERFPNVKIVFGGYSIPKISQRVRTFFNDNPQVDVLVHGEGEATFADLLLRLAGDGDLTKVPGITFQTRDVADGFITNPRRDRIASLDDIPSPFLNGIFDELMKGPYGSLVTGTLWETNRGCPFSCTFCDWGNADYSKVKRFSLERLNSEIEWIARNKIPYIFCADANFGIFYERDIEIAKMIAHQATSSGYPKFFTTNWTKNSHERIVALADILVGAGVIGDVTLSQQSRNVDTLDAIKRVNLDDEKMTALKAAFHARNLPTYTEMILGLPEETYESVVNALDDVMSPRLSDHFIFYPCSILENTELSDPAYMERHQIKTKRCEFAISRRSFDEDSVREYEDIVVGTSKMPTEDWRKTYIFAYFATVMYNHRVAFFPMVYMQREFGVKHTDFLIYLINQFRIAPQDFPVLARALRHVERQCDMILDGISSMSVPEGLDNLTLTVHEGAIALCVDQTNDLYQELKALVADFCAANGVHIAPDLLQDLVEYQKCRMVSWPPRPPTTYQFKHNLPQYFSALTVGAEPPDLVAEATEILVSRTHEAPSSRKEFLRTLVSGGRRVGLNAVKILDSEPRAIEC